MGKSIKLKNDTYIDSSGIHHINKSLKTYLTNKHTFTLNQKAHNSDYPKYYLLAQLPVTSNSNGATLRVNGFLGSYYANAKVIIDVLIANRGGLEVYGTYIGASEAFDNSRLEIYEQTDGQHWIYFAQTENYTGGCVLDVTATNLYGVSCSTTRVTPSGTLVVTIDSSILTKIA